MHSTDIIEKEPRMAVAVHPEPTDLEAVSQPVRNAYLTYLSSTLGRSAGTIEVYRRILRRLALHLDGDLLHAGERDLKLLVNTRPWLQGLGTSAKRTVLTVAIGFYEWAAEEAGLLEVSPAGPLKRLQRKLPSSERKLPTYLSMAEIDLLLAALDWEQVERGTASYQRPRLHAARDRAAAGVMAYAGGRLTETIAGLRLDDVDLKAGEIAFRHLTKRGAHRTVPIGPLLRPLLDAWLRVREDVPSDAFFLSRWRLPISQPD